MKTARKLYKAIASPRLAFQEINKRYHQRRGSGGTDVLAEDWDNLVILDACRFDLFKAHNTLPGALERRTSKGSSTLGFLHGNFGGKELYETVYVTANPQLHYYANDIDARFHAVVNVWKEAGWDESLGTVRPETTTEYARRAAEEYPNKRLVVHYLQPHYPFLTDDTTFDKGQVDDPDDHRSFWQQIRMGDLDVSTDRLWTLYVDNFERTLPHVQDLTSALNGKTVVTSDHGNMFGERSFPVPIREYGHPLALFTDELVEVPWLVQDPDERKRIRADEPTRSADDVEDDAVAKRLRDLGYAE